MQINLRKSDQMRNMMEQTGWQFLSDLVILSDIPKGPPDTPKLVASVDAKCAVALTPTAGFAGTGSGRGLGFPSYGRA